MVFAERDGTKEPIEGSSATKGEMGLLEEQ